MKFVHTADWHIGMKFSSFDPRKANAAREERLDAGRRVVDLANKQQAEFILIAGDLFHDNTVDSSMVRDTASILGKFNGDVFIIPGNHDPLIPGSVWDNSLSWKNQKNVKIFRDNQHEEVGECVLYPCVATAKYNSSDPTAWIDATKQNQISIGIAHGNLDVLQLEAKDIPISKDAASKAGLDYLALGHWHSMKIIGQPGSQRMAYSGTHETGSFGEIDSGYALIVEIANRESPPVITPFKTGALEWRKEEKDIRLQTDLENVIRYISSINSPDKTILALTLTGFLLPDTLDELDRLTLDWKKRFISFSVDTSAMRITPKDDEWLDNLPDGIIRMTASELISMAKTSDQEAEKALEALMELYRISHEVAK